jgi:hypothetical protein
MEKYAATIRLHHLTGLPRDLHEHLTELKIQADQLTQLEQGVKFMDVSGLRLLPGPIFAPANHLSSVALATLFTKGLHRNGSLWRYLLPIGKTPQSVK